jgi:hypothetical protein
MAQEIHAFIQLITTRPGYMSLYTKFCSGLKECFNQRLTWILLLCALFVPFLLLAFFNHPCGDDFCYAHSVRTNPFWSMQSYWYNHANGRYASTFFITLNPLMIGSVFGYKMVILLLLVVYIISLLLLVKLLMGKNSIEVSVLAITFFSAFIYLLKMPSIVEGFYWLSAVMTYQLANISFMVLLILLYHIEKGKNKIILISAAALLCAIIGGSNEPGMLTLLYFLIALSAFAWFISKKIPAHYYLLIIVTVIGILVVVLAPGNAVRSSFFEGNKQVIHSLMSALLASIQHLLRWLPDVLLLTLLFLPFIKDAIVPGFADKKIPLWLLILYPLFMAGMLFIGFFPAQWGMNSLPPPRSVNAIYFLFLLAYLYYIILLVTYVNQQNTIPPIPLYIKCIIGFVLITHVCAKNNIRTAYMDLLSGRAMAYDREMTSRYDQIAKSPDGNISFAPLIFPPSSIFLDDIETEASDWKNVCTSDYFGAKSLKIIKRPNE